MVLLPKGTAAVKNSHKGKKVALKSSLIHLSVSTTTNVCHLSPLPFSEALLFPSAEALGLNRFYLDITG